MNFADVASLGPKASLDESFEKRKICGVGLLLVSLARALSLSTSLSLSLSLL